MTIIEMIDVLKNDTTITWELVPADEHEEVLRGHDSKGHCFCPVTAACYIKEGLAFEPTDVDDASLHLDMSMEEMEAIVHVSDEMSFVLTTPHQGYSLIEARPALDLLWAELKKACQPTKLW